MQQPNMWIDEEVVVSKGDLWALGDHRLFCGDSTKAEDVARLFEEQRFALCFTSPPYAAQRTYKLGSFNWHTLMCDAFDRIIEYGVPDCHILINLGLSHKNRQVDLYWLEWLLHCVEKGWPLFGWYAWDKGSGLPGEWGGRLSPAHEFIFHFNQARKYPNKWVETKESSRRFRKKYTALREPSGIVPESSSPDKYGQEFKIPDSVIRINRECARGMHTQEHPAVFPVALPEFMMLTWSEPGDSVYEPFCGSGTSLIAGSNLNRKVFAMEISEEYCSLAIKRWEQHTGQRARKIEEIL